jgi:hypothetical protein
MDLEELLERVALDTLVRVVVLDDEVAVLLAADFACNDPGVMGILEPLRRRKVRCISCGVSEDPISPNDKLPTMWVDLEE